MVMKPCAPWRRRSPDAVTLDLEMPRMDGFTFLRILMARHPLPVIVVSSHSQKENVFRALELGAIDFVEKPERGFHSEASSEQLVEKVMLARTLRPKRLKVPTAPAFGAEPSTARGLGPNSTVKVPPSLRHWHRRIHRWARCSPRYLLALARPPTRCSAGDPTHASPLHPCFRRTPGPKKRPVRTRSHGWRTPARPQRLRLPWRKVLGSRNARRRSASACHRPTRR